MGRKPGVRCLDVEPGYKRLSECMDRMDDDGAGVLVGAIMRQAVRDLKYSAAWLKAHPDTKKHDYNYEKYREMKKLHDDAERFFKSEWFRLFVNCDGNHIVKTLWDVA